MTVGARTDDSTDARLIFRAGGRRYALAAAQAREIARLPLLTPVPLAPPGLLGLANVRGETLAVIAPLDADMQAVAPRQLLVLDGAERIGLAVEAVERIDRAGAAGKHKAGEVTDLPLAQLIAQSCAQPRAARRARSIQSAQTASDIAGNERLALLRIGIGDQCFALPLEEVVQVLRVPADIARLPGADDAVVGTILWHDRTIGVLSLAVLLGLAAPGGGAGNARRIIIVSLGGQWLGLLVERIEGLLRVTPDRIDPVPATLLRSDSEARISAICRPEAGAKLVSVLAADMLLSEARTRRLLTRAGQQQPAAPSESHRVDRRALLPVRIGPHRLAFPLEAIEKVVAWPVRCTPVPGTPDWLVGIAAIDNKALAVIDQTARLTGSPSSGARQRLVVVQAGGQRVGFLVDAADAILKVAREALAPAPLPKSLAAGIFGDALRLGDAGGDGTLLLVEPAALISSAEQALLADIAARRPSPSA